LRRGASDQAHDMVPTMVEPEKDHEGEKVTEMEGRRGGIHAGVEAYLARVEQPIQSVTIPT
jgi:hypothetical protein